MPNISQLVRNQGQVSLPSNVESEIADTIGSNFDENGNGTQLIAVFNSKSALTEQQNETIKSSLQTLQQDKKKYDITSITSASDNKETAKQVVSKDKTTQMALIYVKNQADLDQLVEKIQNKINTKSLNVYVTGSEVLTNEFSNTTEEGIKKTEVIAAIFIFIVLILVFKSPIVPLISLSTVGISLLISLSIIMNLAEHFNFPISNFTQVFLVVVLFGIGTDYNILLYDQFKEELSKEISKEKAAFTARKKAGRTILYSGLSVLIGFSVLGLAKFSMYQSAVGVAIGVAVLLINLLTFNIFFMTTLGKKMFWPTKKFEDNNNSKLWLGLSKFAIARPFITLAIIGIFAVPFIWSYQKQTLNFNNADELPETNLAKKGYSVIQDHFSKGMTGTTTLYIESDKSLLTQEDFSTIDKLTKYIKAEKGVKSVASVVQPTGKKINSLYLRSQMKTLVKGLKDSKTGLAQISEGLTSANSQLASADLNSQLSDVQTLADGTQSLQAGTQALADGTSKYTSGVDSVTSGLGQLQNGNTTLSDSINQVTSGSTEIATQVSSLQNQVATLENVNTQVSSLMEQLPTLQATLQQSGIDLSSLNQLSTYYTQLNSGVSTLSSSLQQINAQMPTLTTSTNELLAGSQQLSESGTTLDKSATEVAAGATEVNGGVQTLNSQMATLGTQVTSLTTGLTSAVEGTNQIEQGLQSIEDYLADFGDSYMGKEFYIPKATLKDDTLKESYALYMSKNRKITKMTIVLKNDPSTSKAAEQLTSISADVKARLKGTSLEEATVAFGGQTSQTADLESLANSDFTRTAIIMIIGIGLALVVVTRSVIQPLSIIGTLIIAYVASLGITKLISASFLGTKLLTWNTPFFTFIMLVALGVDYSIFLMMRYRDNHHLALLSAVNSIKNASMAIGVVVLSAAFILGGTFAALIPSGVMTLIQVALGVIVGLILLVILLPLVMSAVIKLSYKENDELSKKNENTDIKNY